MVAVVQVVADAPRQRLGVVVRAIGHLRQPGDPGRHQEAPGVVGNLRLPAQHVFLLLGPGAHERHVAAQDAEQERQTVEPAARGPAAQGPEVGAEPGAGDGHAQQILGPALDAAAVDRHAGPQRPPLPVAPGAADAGLVGEEVAPASASSLEREGEPERRGQRQEHRRGRHVQCSPRAAAPVAARGNRARRRGGGGKPLPVGPSRIVDVDVGVDQCRHHHQITEVRGPRRGVMVIDHIGDAAPGEHHRRRPHLAAN